MRRRVLWMHLFRSYSGLHLSGSHTQLILMRLQRFCIRCIDSKLPALANLRIKFNAIHFPVSPFLHIDLCTFVISFPPLPSPVILLADESHTI